MLANDKLIDGYGFSELGRIDGLILISFFIIFLYYIFSLSKATKGEKMEFVKHSLPLAILLFVVGLLGVVVGGKWVVDGAIAFATLLGVSQSLIGLTIVAVGTSLPELMTSAVAAYKKNADIAIGNIVGSNIFNIFWILGLTATINPVTFSPLLNFDIMIVGLATILLIGFSFVGKKFHLERWQGGLFIISYLTYIIFLVIRG